MLPDSLYTSYNNTIVDSAFLSKQTIAIDTFIKPSFFENHLLQRANEQPLIHLSKNDYLSAIILFVVFTLFVWLFTSNKILINKLSGFFYLFGSSNIRQDSTQLSRSMIFLSAVFLMLFSLFIGETIKFYGAYTGTEYGIFLLKIGLVIALMYFIKILIVRIVGFIFKTIKEVNDYTSVLVLFWNSLAVFLFPVVCCMFFVKQVSPYYFIVIGFVGVMIFMLLRTIRILMIGINNTHISKLYLFLYLCTLEILPLAILYKLFLITMTL